MNASDEILGLTASEAEELRRAFESRRPGVSVEVVDDSTTRSRRPGPFFGVRAPSVADFASLPALFNWRLHALERRLVDCIDATLDDVRQPPSAIARLCLELEHGLGGFLLQAARIGNAWFDGFEPDQTSRDDRTISMRGKCWVPAETRFEIDLATDAGILRRFDLRCGLPDGPRADRSTAIIDAYEIAFAEDADWPIQIHLAAAAPP